MQKRHAGLRSRGFAFSCALMASTFALPSVHASAVVPGASAEPGIEIRLTIDRGADIGQHFGGLFEIYSRGHAFALGAGFPGLYNTRHQEDRHTVHFFVRPTRHSAPFTVERLPRPNDLAGVYLFSHDGRVYASEPQNRVWSEAEARWLPAAPATGGHVRLGHDVITFHEGYVECNGAIVLAPPAEGAYTRFYYAQGHLFFYHTFWAGQAGYRPHAGDAGGFTKLYACPWQPADAEAVDLAKAAILTLPFVGEIPFAYGQLGDDVLTCSNIGGLYAFAGGRWRTILEGDLHTSYQIYSMLNFNDRLLMGQYPTGELFEFDAHQVRRLEGWPPRMPGVSASAREAQSTAIYGGELYVGVWPWGELWRYHPDMQHWAFVQRMFPHPAVTEETVHPYENECRELGIVTNQWGQRVTSLVVNGPSLIVSTSAKSPCEWEPRFDFLRDDLWKDYGAVYRLTVPGHASASLRWTDGPTELSFIFSGRSLLIIQDGALLAETELPENLVSAASGRLEMEEPVWGRSLYGPFGGRSLAGEVHVVTSGDASCRTTDSRPTAIVPSG